MPREDARQRLQQRINEDNKIVIGHVQSQDDLSNAEEREKKWRAYNRELLLRIFTSDEYARDYDGSMVSLHQLVDRHANPTLDTYAFRLKESVKRQVARLESIIERLELVDEVPADRDDVSAPTRPIKGLRGARPR
jgi:hypothetical protein